ncbi:MAG: hypothetical protein ACKVP7_13950 [Hyphomicrobiaceae bacterium]
MPATTSRTLRLSSGGPIRLGPRLGGGGEGAVHAIEGEPHLVAKIYHGELSESRKAKLKDMIAARTSELADVTAWPSEMLHSGTAVVGFVMPRADHAEEAHVLYGPKSRKQKFPAAGFHFLVHVAMNLARAFTVVHKCGIVIGDVNERVAMIGQDGKVRLIDCDSFQLKSGPTTHLCEVGVPNYTPPELQGVSSFRGMMRTEQHDLFGLAVLLFHMLFIGRHPFSGRHQMPDEMPIELAIKQNRFAYSADRARTQMAPPPHMPSLSIVSQGIADLFELAFSADAASGRIARPSAAQWVDALEGLLGKLAACRENAAHAYSKDLAACPWCAIEQNSRIELFNYAATTEGGVAIDVEVVWRAIGALQPFQLLALPDPQTLKAQLSPSAEALLIRQTNFQQQHLTQAKKAQASARLRVEKLSELAAAGHKRLEAAEAHAAAFDGDVARLAVLRQRQELATNFAEQLRRWQIGAIVLAPPSGGAALLLSDSLHLTLGVLGIPIFVCLSILCWRMSIRQQVDRIDQELQALQLSIDLGVAPRQQQVVADTAVVRQAADELTAAGALLEQTIKTDAEMIANLRESAGSVGLARAAMADRSKRASEQYAVAKARHREAAAAQVQAAHAFTNLKSEAQVAYQKYRDIEARRTRERQQAKEAAHEEQLSDYLDQFFISNEAWPGIPKSALTALMSYGIETAADIEREAVLNVPGFGTVRTQRLLDWRKSKSALFRFDPSKSNVSSRLQQTDRRLIQERRPHERALVKIKGQLDSIHASLFERRDRLMKECTQAATELAQSLADAEAIQPRQTAQPATPWTAAKPKRKSRSKRWRPW